MNGIEWVQNGFVEELVHVKERSPSCNHDGYQGFGGAATPECGSKNIRVSVRWESAGPNTQKQSSRPKTQTKVELRQQRTERKRITLKYKKKDPLQDTTNQNRT